MRPPRELHVLTHPFPNRRPSGLPVFKDAMRTAAGQAIGEWSEVANVTFVEVPDAGAGGAIRFGTESMSDAAGYAYYPSSTELGGDIWIANNFDYNTSPVVGNYGYLTLKIGRAHV